MALTVFIPPTSLTNLPGLSENLILQSVDPGGITPWGSANVSLVVGKADAFGGSTAVQLNEVSGGYAAREIIAPVTGIAAGQRCTLSAYFSPQNLLYAFLGLKLSASDWAAACFDLSRGVVYDTGHGSSTTFGNATITSVGGGWWRCSVTATLAGAVSDAVFGPTDGLVGTLVAGDSVYLGTGGADTTWICGPQIERTAAATTYHPTTTTTFTGNGIWANGLSTGLPVMPWLPGRDIVMKKAPLWSTQTIRTASGRERRTAYWNYPLWQFEVDYGVMRHRNPGLANVSDELQLYWEFFNYNKGGYAPWLFVDPTDCQVPQANPAPFATGDGLTTQFQLTRRLFTQVDEPVYDIYAPTILDNGSPSAGTITYQPNGKVTISPAPLNGHILSWYGYFYFGCRFLADDSPFQQEFLALWTGKGHKFTSLRV